MEKILFHLLVLTMSLIAGGYGLDFNFTLLSSTDLTCGTLICSEDTSPVPGASLHQNSLSQGNISSMVIFKTIVATLDAKGQTIQSSPIASLNDEKPSVTYASDKVKIYGHLGTTEAMMQIELASQEDCRAEFTCQVTVFDLQGKNPITTSRVLQQSRPDKNETGVAEQLGLDSTHLLVQQMSDKINFMEKLMRYQQKTSYSWKRFLQRRMKGFETNISSNLRLLNEKLSFFSKENRSQGFPVDKEKEQNGTGHTSPSLPVESTADFTPTTSTSEISTSTTDHTAETSSSSLQGFSSDETETYSVTSEISTTDHTAETSSSSLQGFSSDETETSTVTVGTTTQEYSVTTFAPILHPVIPVITQIKGGFYPGKKIHITGRPNQDANRFQVNLICGESSHSDQALHFDVRIKYNNEHNVIVRNSRRWGHYGEEERYIPYFPFSRGVGFDMVLLCESDSIKVIINNWTFTEFKHRILPLRWINHLYIVGDVDISAIKFD